MNMKSRITTFSRTFPAYHPRRGESTHFVEGILTQLNIDYTDHHYFIWLIENNPKISERFLDNFFNSLSVNIPPKSHTIRAHKKPLKIGEFINPVCWAGVPYHKTKEGYWQIRFCPDIMVQHVQKFNTNEQGSIFVDGKHFPYFGEICKNDGLNGEDFLDWFKIEYDSLNNKPFNGNIIIWNEHVKY